MTPNIMYQDSIIYHQAGNQSVRMRYVFFLKRCILVMGSFLSDDLHKQRPCPDLGAV